LVESLVESVPAAKQRHHPIRHGLVCWSEKTKHPDLWQNFRRLAKMVTGTKFRIHRSRFLVGLRARKFEPVTTFAELAISTLAKGSNVSTA
jgi:hypothetical protein